MQILKVSSTSKPLSVAGAIVVALNENNGKVEIHAIGAGAVNQAVKAIAISRGIIATSGKDIVCIPAFCDIKFNGIEKTGINLIVKTI